MKSAPRAPQNRPPPDWEHGKPVDPEAVDGNRTHDLFLTKEVLYQLSYNSGTNPPLYGGRSGRWDLNPRQPAWKAGALPLSYTRTRNVSQSGWRGIRTPELRGGQIYSLVQLTTLPSTRLKTNRAARADTPQSHRWGSNPRPTVYKTVALPLCYDGGLRESINIGPPGGPTRFGRPAGGKMSRIGRGRRAGGSQMTR